MQKGKLNFKQQNGLTEVRLKQSGLSNHFLLDSDVTRERIKDWLRIIAYNRYYDVTDSVKCLLRSISSKDVLFLTYLGDNGNKIVVEAPESFREPFYSEFNVNDLEQLLNELGRSEIGYKSVLKNAFPEIYRKKEQIE